MFPTHALVASLLAQAEDDNLFEIADGLIDGATGVVQAAFLLGAIIVVGATYFVTRAFVPVLVAVVLAGGVLWGVNRADDIGDSAIETVEDAPGMPDAGTVGGQTTIDRSAD